ncbi:hypothetical protein OG21DRAFT_1525349 [Imleria badia]|nr:hypothetical protein OG21DRAFT_1525349 [Imleria badia]
MVRALPFLTPRPQPVQYHAPKVESCQSHCWGKLCRIACWQRASLSGWHRQEKSGLEPVHGVNYTKCKQSGLSDICEFKEGTSCSAKTSALPNNATQAAYLDSIAEFDEVYGPSTFDEDNEDMDIPASPTEALRSADQLLSVMTTGTSEPEYMDIDEGQSEMSSENFNLEDVQSTSNDEDKSDAALDNLLQQRRPSKPVVTVAPQACRKQKQQTAKKIVISDDDTSEDFTIQCSAPCPDGIHAPFKILSTITLITLRDVVAEKMGRHPKTVRLQYHLDSDKAKQASTLIHSNDELDIFIGRLQDLIVPGRLPSGHKSTCTPKNPVVHFEDTSFGNASDGSTPSKGISTAKQKTRSAESADPELDGASHHLKLIQKLQERWRCKIHSKGNDKWCYSPSGSNICQTMTISNLSFWAIQIAHPTNGILIRWKVEH